MSENIPVPDQTDDEMRFCFFGMGTMLACALSRSLLREEFDDLKASTAGKSRSEITTILADHIGHASDALDEERSAPELMMKLCATIYYLSIEQFGEQARTNPYFMAMMNEGQMRFNTFGSSERHQYEFHRLNLLRMRGMPEDTPDASLPGN